MQENIVILGQYSNILCENVTEEKTNIIIPITKLNKNTQIIGNKTYFYAYVYGNKM